MSQELETIAATESNREFAFDGSEKRSALIQVHIAAVLVSFPGLFGKWLTLSPAMIAFSRMAVGAVALGVFIWIAKLSWRIPARRVAIQLFFSSAALAVNTWAFYESIRVSSVAIGLLAFSTVPLFVTFLEPLVFREPLRRRDLVTAIMVAVGLSVIAPISDFSSNLTQGILWGLLAAFSCAVLSLLSRSSIRRMDPVAVTFYQQAFAAVFTLPAVASFHGEITGQMFGLLAVLGVMFTALPQALICMGMRHLRAQVTSVIIALGPVYGIVLAAILLGEIPSARTLLGGSLIVGAVIWASILQGRAKSELIAGHGRSSGLEGRVGET